MSYKSKAILKKSISDIIALSIKSHGNFYDYSKSIYRGFINKMEIICPIHGIFSQRVSDHINGRGCKKCGIIKYSISQRSNTDEFIEKAKNIHGDKYGYSEVIYKTNKSHIKIECFVHGIYLMRPDCHLFGKSGCPKCKAKKFGDRTRKSLNDFINSATKIHGKKYDYSKVTYINSTEKIEIICSKHGNFWQSPAGHIHSSNGCSQCTASKGEMRIKTWLTLNNILYITQHKFIDCKNPKTNMMLRFDFYIPDRNLLIEFDGEQHFKRIRFGNHFISSKEFEYIKYKDDIKNKYAISNGIKLLRIPYTNSNNIPSILEFEFKSSNLLAE